MDTSLYLIATQYKQAAETLAQLDLDEQTMADTLESIGGELEEKVINLAMMTRNLESSAEQIQQAAQAMNERAQKLIHRAAKIREYLVNTLNYVGIKKFDNPYFKLAVQKNPGAVVIDKDASIPTEFMRQPPLPEPVPDKERIKKALQANVNVPGCQLVYRFRVEIQ